MLYVRGVILAAVLLGAGLFMTDGASAQGTPVGVTSALVGTSSPGTVHLRAMNLAPPGLGAWTIDVSYDPSKVTVVSCVAPGGSLCNPAFSSSQVRVVGATAPGITGDFTLASITFSCDGIGASNLVAVVDVFKDGSLNTPQQIATKVEHGTITCTAGTPLLGDVNCSNEVDAVDASLILQYEAGLIDDLPCLENGDVNSDGEVNSVDAFLVLLLISGL